MSPNKNNQHLMNLYIKSLPKKQSGVAILSIVLVLLVILSLLSMTAAKESILETKMVFNLQDKQRAVTAADSAAQYGWEQVKSNLDIKNVINNDNDGYYVLGDAIEQSAGAKPADDWDTQKNVMTWPWGYEANDANKRFEIPVQLGGINNPMKLKAKPQYTVGMHNSVIRKGTSNQRCLPMSIIGASQGGTSQTRSLIELKTIPKSSCFTDIVK